MQKKNTNQVQSTPRLEPLNLPFIERVRKLNLILCSILVLHHEGQIRSRWKALQPKDVNLVSTFDFIIILGVGKCQCEHSLLLEVCFVDTGEAADNDSKTSKETWFESGVFARGTLAVIVVTNDNPLDASIAVRRSNLGNAAQWTSELVQNFVGLAVLSVDGTDKAVF